MNLLKNFQTNWKYILILVILAALVGSGILSWINRQEIPPFESPEIKKPEKIITSQQIILSDEEVVKILREFAQERTIKFNDVGATEILLDALVSEDANLKSRVQELIKKFEDLSEKIEDAPYLRSWEIQGTKVCLAESIIFNDLENTTHRCGYEPDFSFTAVDDLLADTEVIPFFINGYAYYYKKEYQKADYYLNQIKLHYDILKDIEYVDLDAEYLELYNKIYNKVLKLLQEIAIGKTANWKTLKSTYLGFEVKYPLDWSYSEEGGGPNLYSPSESTEEPQPITWRAVLWFDRTGRQSFDEFVAGRFGPTTNNKIISDSTISLNSLTGREIIYTCKDCKIKYIPERDMYIRGGEGRVILISKNSDTFIIWFGYYKDDPIIADYLETFNQILSTFMFLE